MITLARKFSDAIVAKVPSFETVSRAGGALFIGLGWWCVWLLISQAGRM